MKVIKPVYRRQEGQTLLYVLCFLFLAIGLVASILDLSSNHRKIAQQQVNMESAMYVGEAGLELGASYLASNITTIAAVTYTNGSIGQGSYSCMITQLDWRTYRIISTGTVNNVSRVVRLQRIFQPTYAEFALFSTTNGVIWFTVGDVFTGHVHSDTEMYFMNPGGNSGPIFHDACDSRANCYYSEPGGSPVKNGSLNGVTFDKGFQLNSYQGNIAQVDFNSSSPDSLLSEANNNNGLVLQGTTTITFNGGTLSFVNKIYNQTYHPTNLGFTNSYTPASEGLIYIKNAPSAMTDKAGRAYLKGGNVTGRLTIVTEEDTYVNGSILYTNDPRVNPASTDALGIISGVDVVVNTNAPDNLEIDAEMMATSELADSGYSSPFNPYGPGSFGVIDYNVNSPRGILTLYGGIVQENRGAVGQLGGGGVVIHGYLKNYSYDQRFIDNPPPFYPTVKDKFRWNNWQEGPY